MILNIETANVFGVDCNKVRIIGVYDDLETVYQLRAAILDEQGNERSSNELRIEGEEYTSMDWNTHEPLLALIEQRCNVKIIK